MDTPTTLGLEPQPQPPAPPSNKLHFILGWFGIALGLFLALFRAWVWSYGIANAEMLGYALGGALLPALIAYLIAGRKSVRNFSRFGVWFSGLSLFFFIVSNQRPVSVQQHIGDLMKEAAGTKPVDNSGPRSMDELVRDIMRDILDERKAFDRDMGRFNPELGKLYSVESFSSKEAMQRSVDAVRGAVAVDQRYSQQLESLPQRIQTRVDRSGLSDSFDSGFMEGVRKAYGESKPLNLRRQAMEVEKQWGVATVAFYEFAIANSTKIRAEGSHLVIGNEKLRTEFNARMKQSQTLRDNLTALNTQMESAQREVMQQSGLKPSDVGLEDTSHPAGK
jgi:hypothetical protein